MSRPSCQLAFRLALALAVALCAGALAGCNKAPALIEGGARRGQDAREAPQSRSGRRLELPDMPPRTAGHQEVAGCGPPQARGASFRYLPQGESCESGSRRGGDPIAHGRPSLAAAASQTSSPGVRRSPGLVVCLWSRCSRPQCAPAACVYEVCPVNANFAEQQTRREDRALLGADELALPRDALAAARALRRRFA